MPLSIPAAPDPDPALLITGAAGLVGQNLIMALRECGYQRITAIDCHAGNLAILKRLNPDITVHRADLSRPGDWTEAFAGIDAVFQLQAQISATDPQAFADNTVRSTEAVIAACRQHGVRYLIHVSSSVVNSAADDAYVRSKTAQEQLVAHSGLAHAILRPTLMFGWFDRKHLGWLSRFMARFPVFPVPGHGRYLRQPLYVRDFCRILIRCLEIRPQQQVFDISGQEGIDYIALIRRIRHFTRARCLVVPVPVPLFRLLLQCYALFSRNPPFTAEQLDALIVGDIFSGVDMATTFGLTPTPLDAALAETFTAQPWSTIVLER